MDSPPSDPNRPGNTELAQPWRKVSVAVQQAQPPANFYVTEEDVLRITLRGPLLAFPTQLYVDLRFWRPDGYIVTWSVPTTWTADATALAINLPEGFLVGVTVHTLTVNFAEPGQAYVTASLVRNNTAAAAVFSAILIASYVTVSRPASWPYGPQSFMQEGPARMRSITGTTPAAGAEINEVVPAGVRWRVIAFYYSLVTAVAVANRTSVLLIDDGANVFARSVPSVVQAASTTFTYSRYHGESPVSDTINDLVSSLPEMLFVSAGYRFRTLTASIQAADQYAAPQYLVQEWISE